MKGERERVCVGLAPDTAGGGSERPDFRVSILPAKMRDGYRPD
jgi:hypothetical protein